MRYCWKSQIRLALHWKEQIRLARHWKSRIRLARHWKSGLLGLRRQARHTLQRLWQDTLRPRPSESLFPRAGLAIGEDYRRYGGSTPPVRPPTATQSVIR
jgi:hypothetical protein